MGCHASGGLHRLFLRQIGKSYAQKRIHRGAGPNRRGRYVWFVDSLMNRAQAYLEGVPRVVGIEPTRQNAHTNANDVAGATMEQISVW